MRLACWKIMPILSRRTSSSTSTPLSCAVPESGVIKPAATDRRVDLPEPDSPTMKVISPGLAVKSRWSSTVRFSWPSWNATVMSFSSSIMRHLQGPAAG